MSANARWFVAIVAAVLVICLLVWARGDEHRHGIQIGALGAASSASWPGDPR